MKNCPILRWQNASYHLKIFSLFTSKVFLGGRVKFGMRHLPHLPISIDGTGLLDIAGYMSHILHIPRYENPALASQLLFLF